MLSTGASDCNVWRAEVQRVALHQRQLWVLCFSLWLSWATITYISGMLGNAPYEGCGNPHHEVWLSLLRSRTNLHASRVKRCHATRSWCSIRLFVSRRPWIGFAMIGGRSRSNMGQARDAVILKCVSEHLRSATTTLLNGMESSISVHTQHLGRVKLSQPTVLQSFDELSAVVAHSTTQRIERESDTC